MSIRSRVLSCLIAIGVAGSLAACGGSSSVTGPDVAAPASTATIAGTVVSAGTAGAPTGDISTRSSSGGIRVSLLGTSLETMTDDSGRFTLGGVTPSEKVELHFEGPGIDARLEIEGLAAGQTLAITVNVSGSTASMLTPSGEVEFRGTVDSVGDDRLVVSDRTVLVVSGTTELLGRQNQPIDLSDITAGAFVEVEGWEQPDGSLLGKKVKLEDGGATGAGAEIEFRGTVDSVGGDRLVVSDRTVLVVSGTTELLGRQNQPIDLSDITAGAFVEVEGWEQPDGSLLGKKVKLEDGGATGAGAEIEFRGTVDSMGGGRLVVSGRTVLVVDGTTELLGRQNQPIDLSDITAGAFVEVEGWEQPDGSLLGKKIKLEDGPGDDPNDPLEVEFVGNIQSLSPLMVAGTRVSTDTNTRILDDDNVSIGLSALAVGMRVEVEGWPQVDGSVLAKKIKIED